MITAGTDIITIRKGTPDDFVGVTKLIEQFQDEALHEYGFKLDGNKAIQFMAPFTQGSFILEVMGRVEGVLAGVVAPYPLSGELMYFEMIWFVSRQYRKYGIKMLVMLEDWCRTQGIKKIVMIHLGNSKSEKIERFYESHGYSLLECHYIKDLK